jgi:hypothetical protein
LLDALDPALVYDDEIVLVAENCCHRHPILASREFYHRVGHAGELVGC